jgi:opacity protein-like surface antigen
VSDTRCEREADGGVLVWEPSSGVASVAAGVGVADLAVNAPVYKAAPVILSDWSRFYIGVNGWVAGAGLEYKFYGNWIARAEYLHYDFDNANLNLSGVAFVIPGNLSRETLMSSVAA